MASVLEVEADEQFAEAVGACLRAARKQRGLSLLAVESVSGREFKASVLGAYERGQRVISILRLQRLAEIYDVPVGRLVPRPTRPAMRERPEGTELFSLEEGTPVAPVWIDLTSLSQATGSEGQLIRHYFEGIRGRRRNSMESVISVRQEDLRSLGRALQLNLDGVVRRLRELGLGKL